MYFLTNSYLLMLKSLKNFQIVVLHQSYEKFRQQRCPKKLYYTTQHIAGWYYMMMLVLQWWFLHWTGVHEAGVLIACFSMEQVVGRLKSVVEMTFLPPGLEPATFTWEALAELYLNVCQHILGVLYWDCPHPIAWWCYHRLTAQGWHCVANSNLLPNNLAWQY